jgi:hypothetical protein
VTGSKTVGATYSATASCGAGQTLIGGGAHVTQGNTGSPSTAAVTDSYPSTTGVAGTWTAGAVTVVAGNGGSVAPTITAYAICAQ